MLKSGLAAVLSLIAAPALAQDPAPAAGQNAANPTPPPAFMAAAQTFGECIGNGINGAPRSGTAEAAATRIIAACATQKTAVETQFNSWISGPDFPAGAREPARAQFNAQFGTLNAQVAQAVTQHRAAGRNAPAAARTPSH